MKARTTKLSVTPGSCSLFELGATHIHIRDEAAGEFVTVTLSDKQANQAMSIKQQHIDTLSARVDCVNIKR